MSMEVSKIAGDTKLFRVVKAQADYEGLQNNPS